MLLGWYRPRRDSETRDSFHPSYALSVASELSACALIMAYWLPNVNAAAWIAAFSVPFIVVNMLGAKYYGEAEVITSSLKVITLVG